MSALHKMQCYLHRQCYVHVYLNAFIKTGNPKLIDIKKEMKLIYDNYDETWSFCYETKWNV